MKVIINKEKCAGHARCNAVAPVLYQLDDDGYIATTGFTVASGMEQIARQGARACPERVIRVVAEDDDPREPAA